jgi:hypothetical protein
VAVTSGCWAKVGAGPVSTVAEDVFVRSCTVQKIVYGSEVVFLQIIEVDVCPWPLGPVSLGTCSVPMEHFE